MLSAPLDSPSKGNVLALPLIHLFVLAILLLVPIAVIVVMVVALRRNPRL